MDSPVAKWIASPSTMESQPIPTSPGPNSRQFWSSAPIILKRLITDALDPGGPEGTCGVQVRVHPHALHHRRRADHQGERRLRGITPRFTRTDIDHYRQVLADVGARGYGTWRFDDADRPFARPSRRNLGVFRADCTVARQLINLMTMVALRFITRTLETDLPATEFVILPIFGRTGQPDYQIEIQAARTPRHSMS